MTVPSDVEECILTCIHEAGHAVIRAWLGLPFEYVTVKSDVVAGSAGHVLIPPGMLQHNHMDEMIAAAAGKAAMDLLSELSRNEYPLLTWESSGSDRDLNRIEALACFVEAITTAADDPEQYIVDPRCVSYVLKCAMNILRILYVWRTVEVLVDRLLSDPDIAILAKEVHRILVEHRTRYGAHEHVGDCP